MSKRHKRNRRRAAPLPMRLQRRDEHIITAVSRFRVLRQDQIQTLFFGPTGYSAAKRRLRKLYDHRYLERVTLPVVAGAGRSPTLYVLDRRGAELLKTRQGHSQLKWWPSSKNLKTEFLEHTLAINDFMIAVILACQRSSFRLERWLTENELKADYDRVDIETQSGKTKSVAVIPDSYFVLSTPHGKAHFCLELDRGTMSLKRFKDKIRAYYVYAHSRSVHVPTPYQKRYGTRSLRVLTVVDSQTHGKRRQANLKSAAEEVTSANWFWFSTLSSLTPETVLSAPVWQQAGSSELKSLIKPV
jgi:hypothetical protein